METRKITPFVAALCLWGIFAAAGRSPAAERARNPHLREGCIDCHGDRRQPAGEGATIIIDPESEDTHAAVVHSCLGCHKEGAGDFWILVLPKGKTGRPAAAAARPTPAKKAGTGEGFENQHDSMECTSCHERKPRSLQAVLEEPFPYGPAGTDIFCLKCHEKAYQSHFPRENRPRGRVTCVTCHQVHGNATLFPSLKIEYPLVLVKGTEFNPHGGRLFCLSCHRDSPEKGQEVTFREEGDATAMCRRCHRSTREHHPLGVLSTPDTWKMDFTDFPLNEGALTCASCHDPYECEESPLGKDPLFLRGGPYQSQDDFCTRCHEGRSLSSDNIHDMIDEGGKPVPGKCLICHVDVPDDNSEFELMEFTDELGPLCLGCHKIPPHPHDEYQPRLPGKMIKSVKEFEERSLVTLPLEEEVFTTCVTCHNPHERGLLRGPAGIGADERHRLRLPTLNEICSPCHGRS